MTSEKVAEDIESCVRQNLPFHQLPIHLQRVLHNNQRDYEKFVFNYSLKNQLRFRGNLASKVFRNEKRYYELLIQKSVNGLCLFPYHLADIVTKGLRVTPFNYYLDVLSQLLRNDKSYDTLPNFTAADCLRVLGIGRNEYLALISEIKTHSTRGILFTAKPNPCNYLPKFPIRIRIEPWWRIEVGHVLETDIKYVTTDERCLLDDLIDFGSIVAGKCDYNIVQNLYRKGLIYLDVPISGEDRICIPPLRNFVMNRVNGDYFENLLYKIFVSADEDMTISELSQMLQVNLDTVKQAVSLFCRLGFARLKEVTSPTAVAAIVLSSDDDSPRSNANDANQQHPSWRNLSEENGDIFEPLQITPLNYNSLTKNKTSPTNNANVNNPNELDYLPTSTTAGGAAQSQLEKPNLIGYNSSDGYTSDYSFANMTSPKMTPNSNSGDFTAATAMMKKYNTSLANTSETEPDFSSELEDLSENTATTKDQNQKQQQQQQPLRSGKRVGFLFDSTLTAFLMMGNLSPSLKNHAVTMFEVGKLCEESMDTFLAELEKVSLLDAEGEGDVSRYFAHAVILRSTICSLRYLLPGGLDLLRLECLECLDQKTRNRVLEKKYKFIISATPLTAHLSNLFTIPFFGQFYRSSESTQMWIKLFYNHISGYGPPGLFLCRGTVLKTLPRIFLGYGKLLINILHSDSYVINSENFRNLNEQLRNGCVLIQGYGIRSPGELRYESFPFDETDPQQLRWLNHKAVKRLMEYLDLVHHCGFITFLNTGVPDIGCENYELPVQLQRHAKTNQQNMKNSILEKRRKSKETTNSKQSSKANKSNTKATISNSSAKGAILMSDNAALKTPDENYFSITPQSCNSPSNVYTSADCQELLATEIANCKGAVGNNIIDNGDAITDVDNYEQELGDRRNHLDENRLELISQSSLEIPITPAEIDVTICGAIEAAASKIDGDGNLRKANVDDPELELDLDFDVDADVDDQPEDWTLLDVNFGVPLFDVDCNTRICQQLTQRRLCNDDNIELLTKNATYMNDLFLQFVCQCLQFVDDDENYDDGAANQRIITTAILDRNCNLPQPRINLAFENGRVCYWSGR